MTLLKVSHWIDGRRRNRPSEQISPWGKLSPPFPYRQPSTYSPGRKLMCRVELSPVAAWPEDCAAPSPGTRSTHCSWPPVPAEPGGEERDAAASNAGGRGCALLWPQHFLGGACLGTAGASLPKAAPWAQGDGGAMEGAGLGVSRQGAGPHRWRHSAAGSPPAPPARPAPPPPCPGRAARAPCLLPRAAPFAGLFSFMNSEITKACLRH